MDNHILLALSKALEKQAKDKKARDGVSAGVHEIHQTVTLQLDGTLTVGADHETIPTPSIPWKTAMALFIRYSGCTGQAAMDALVKAMNEALDMDEEAVEKLSEVADLSKALEKVKEGLAKLPKQPVKGKVTHKLVVTEVAS